MFFNNKKKPVAVKNRKREEVNPFINRPPHINIDDEPAELFDYYADDVHPTFDVPSHHHTHDYKKSSEFSLFNSPAVGSASCFIEHSEDPERWDENCFGVMIDVDNPAFQRAFRDVTVYDKDLNIIADKSNIGAIGFAVSEDYARPVVDAVDSMNSIIRCKYNQIYGLQKDIVNM